MNWIMVHIIYCYLLKVNYVIEIGNLIFFVLFQSFLSNRNRKVKGQGGGVKEA